MKPLLILPVLLVAACASAEQQIAEDQAWCIRYGYQLGSQGLAECVSREQQTKYLAHEIFHAGVAASLK